MGQDLFFEHLQPRAHGSTGRKSLASDADCRVQHQAKVEPPVTVQPEHPAIPGARNNSLVDSGFAGPLSIVRNIDIPADRSDAVEACHLLVSGIVVEAPGASTKNIRKPGLDD